MHLSTELQISRVKECITATAKVIHLTQGKIKQTKCKVTRYGGCLG